MYRRASTIGNCVSGKSKIISSVIPDTLKEIESQLTTSFALQFMLGATDPSLTTSRVEVHPCCQARETEI